MSTIAQADPVRAGSCRVAGVAERDLRVVIADAPPGFRSGLRAVLSIGPGISVVGEARDGDELLALVSRCVPDVVVMDVQVPGVDGLEATRLIKQRYPDVRVVLLSLHSSYRAEAAKAGGDAFLVKGHSGRELLDAVLGPRP